MYPGFLWSMFCVVWIFFIPCLISPTFFVWFYLPWNDQRSYLIDVLLNLIVQAMLNNETLNVSVIRFSTIFPSVQQAVRKREQSLQVSQDFICSMAYTIHCTFSCLALYVGAIHLWRPHGGGGGGQAQVNACGRGRGSSPMLTSTQKIKISVHWRHIVFFSCKEVGVFFTRISSLERKKWKFFGDIN